MKNHSEKSMKASTPTLIFDFDGTITDIMPFVESFLHIYNELAALHGFRLLERSELEVLRGLNTRDIYKSLQIPVLKLPLFILAFRTELSRRLDNLTLAPGFEAVLKELAKREFRLGILTSNSQENVEQFLHSQSFEVFEFIYSGSSTFGKHRVMQKMTREHQLNPQNVWYFGDETRDIEAAQKAGFHAVGVSWGINTREILLSYHPQAVLDTPSEILNLNFSAFTG